MTGQPVMSDPPRLDAELEQQLQQHLAEVLAPAAVRDAIFAFRLLLPQTEYEAGPDPGLAATKAWSQQHRHERAVERAHFAGLADHATALQAAIARQRPLAGTAGLDWAAFGAALDIVIASAREHSRPPQSTTGAPAFEWRDRLIALVWSLYPSKVRSTKRGRGHVGDTVRLLLNAIHRDVENVHEVIAGARKRRPDPPFRIGKRPQNQ